MDIFRDQDRVRTRQIGLLIDGQVARGLPNQSSVENLVGDFKQFGGDKRFLNERDCTKIETFISR